MVPAGVDPYPLLSAGSLSWDGVEVGNTTLYTTDDLLDYIKGGNSSIIGRIDELELSNAGYEVRCNKSVCYVGDTLNRELVHIYKNGTELDWNGIQTDGITLKSPITKPSGAIDLIQFTSNGQWLDGTANVAGTYIFEFMKDSVCIASFRFIVLIPTYKSATITVYKSSDTLPLKPVGVSYNFNSNPASINVGESDWSTSTTGLTGTIWFCTGHVNEANPSTVLWNEPCIYLNSKIVNTENEYRVKEVAIYKAARGPYTETVNGTQITYNKVIPAKPTTTGCYTFALDPANDSFQAPSGWFTEPEAAIEAYKGNAQNNSFKDNYRVWKSYNSYRITVNKLTDPNTLLQDTLSESGWTSPVEYLNIDKILEDARTQSEQIAQTALQNAYNDLDLGSDLQTVVDAINVVFAWRIVGDASNNNPLSNISDKYVELVDDADTSSAQHQLFTIFSGYRKQNGNYEGSLDMMNNTRDLCVSGYQMKALKFDSVYFDSQEYLNKWVAFIPTTTEIRTQISDLNEDLGELSTAVNAMNPHEIRLQVSKGFKKDVTWTEVDVTEWRSARTEIDGHSDDEEYDIDYGDTIRHSERTTSSNDWEYMAVPSINDDFINALPADPYDTNHLGGFRYGHYYSVHYGSYSAGDENAGYKYFRCDFPVSTGFLSILADKVNLGVADTQGGKATLQLKVKNGNGTASVVANQIVLDGETIADAIAAKSLNINNTTYLCKDGDVYFGVPTGVNNSATIDPDLADKTNFTIGGKSSRFNADGSGQLCGGNINWTSNGILYVKEAHIGESGSNWLIKTANNLPTIYSKDNSTNQELFITPQYLNAVKNSTTYWAIQRDGYASFAQGRAEFSPTGVFHLGGQPNTQTTSGKQDGYMHFDPTEGTLTIGGENVVIASDVMAQITAGVADTDEFASIVADAASSSVSINGMLATQDIDVGNGSSYFSTGHDTKTYRGHTYNSTTSGAGHLANGNIWWDKVGNLHAKGLMTNRCVYVPGNNDNKTVVLDGNNLHSVTLAPMEHRMVVLPTYNDFTDPKNGWFVKGYKEDGTVINIKTEPCDSCSNWSMMDEEAWFNGGNWAGTADLFKHCTLVCADPATLCLGAGNSGNLPVHSWKGANPTTSSRVYAEFKDNAMLDTAQNVDFPYYDGRFCARGAYSRFILLPPGQSLTLTSSIQKITVGNQEMSYLVWNVENASEFSFIKMGIVDSVNNSDVFDKNNALIISSREQEGIGDGLLSYKYMSFDYYTKENVSQQSVTGPDINKSIYIYLYEADADSNKNYPGNIIKPSWQTSVLQNSRYNTYISNTVTISNN